jgi:hypothetical protein
VKQTLFSHSSDIICFQNGASPDFVTGVTSKLVDKLGDDVRFAWSPSTIADINPATIEASFFNHDSPFFGDKPTLAVEVPEQIPPSFLRFSLPTEYYVESVVKGTTTNSTPLALTREEVIDDILQTFQQKAGAREKIEEILDRKTKVLDDPDNQGCLGGLFSLIHIDCATDFRSVRVDIMILILSFRSHYLCYNLHTMAAFFVHP